MASPASLPSGHQLKDIAVRHLLPPKAFRDSLARLHRLPGYHRLPPEIVFQRLHDAMGPKLTPFFDILSLASPNASHQTIAALANRLDAPILTTNFDLLVDKLTLHRHRRIVHLHGALDRPRDLVVRINQVGKGLAPDLRAIVSRATADRTLYVFGYSGSDHDIIQALRSCSMRRIIWIVRSTTSAVERNLRPLSEAHETVLTSLDLHSFFKQVARHLRISLERTSADRTIDGRSIPSSFDLERRDLLKRWSSALTPAERIASLEALLFEADAYRAAIRVCRTAIRARYTDAQYDAAYFWNASAMAWRDKGDFRRAALCARFATQSESSVVVTRAAAHNIRGLLLLEQTQPRPKKALPYFHRARGLLRKSRAAALLGRILNNKGLAYTYSGDPAAALRCYQESLRYKRRLGDIPGIAQTSSNMALLYLGMARPTLYKRWEERVLSLTERYGLPFQRAYFLREAGETLARNGNRLDGLRMLREALNLYDRVGSRFGQTLTRKVIRGFI